MFLSGCQSVEENKKAENQTTAPAGKPPAVVQRKYNDIARFIAGLPPEEGSNLAEASGKPAWKKYSAAFDKNWSSFDSTKISVMRRWASEQFPGPGSDTSTVFYPFGGPDFLYAFTFFPSAGKYVLVGLEPVGTVPDPAVMSPDSMDQFFSAVDRSLNTVLSLSFFKFDNMKVDLKKEVDGAVPVLMIFLARTANRIDDLKAVEINEQGDIVPSDSSRTAGVGRKTVSGVEITFETPESHSQKYVYYFSVNLENEHLKKTPNFMSYLGKQGRVNTLVKSAEYLMYKSYFSDIRSAILERSVFILQDDSGIPYRYFDHEKWDVGLYGVYSRPIDMFKEHVQEDLSKEYKEGRLVKPLPFGIGYNWRQGHSNLLAARKK